VFEHFTDRARRVIALAVDEARRLNHNYVGTEHILVGLIDEGDGRAAILLKGSGATLDGVRLLVEQVVGVGPQPPSGHIPFSPRTTKLIGLARDEAKALGSGYVRAEHLLLGLIREGEGVGVQILHRLGVDVAHLRQQTIDLLGQP
jgi:ATP-dependent Clp protease ATP-binding subunit ClpC